MPVRALIFPGIMIVYGLFSFLFAFRQPPRAVASLYRIPVLFLLVPAAFRVPVARVALGLLSIAVGAWTYVQLAPLL